MIKEVPKELFDLTWSCRSADGPCGKCPSCAERKKYEVFNINH
jgi:7-cyano-7-deazaguanine synthase in queuosine biosynthesis